MRPLAIILYNICRLLLLALVLAFASFLVTASKGFDNQTVLTAMEYSSRYVPILLVPVSVLIVVGLILRYFAKGKGEKLNFGDFFAAIIAFALQIVVIGLYQTNLNQTGEIVQGAGHIMQIPKMDVIAGLAQNNLGLSIATVLAQIAVFFFYWVADPNPKPKK